MKACKEFCANRVRLRVPFRSFVRSQNVYVPLRVDGDGGKCIQYNLYRTNHMWIRILHFAGWSGEAFLLWPSGSFRWSAIFLLVNTGCSCWLIFVPRSPSRLQTTSADFWSLNGNVIRTRLLADVWTGSVGCWGRLIAESMSFSGCFNFKNIPFKVAPYSFNSIYTWKRMTN